MIAAIFNNANIVDIEQYQIRDLKADELLIEVKCCGVCGTDFHIIKEGNLKNTPVILGHEYSGLVVEKGKNCKKVSLDDHIAVDPNIFCGHCYFCKKGEPNYCLNHKALGVDINGGFAQYSIVPESQVIKLEKTDYSDSAFAEPLSCCVRGIEQSDLQLGDSVLIAGAGSIGLTMLKLILMRGVSKTVVIEPVKRKRKIAELIGADILLDPDTDNIQKIVKNEFPNGIDKIFDCVGSSKIIEDSLKYISRGGRLILFGVTPKSETVKLNVSELFKKELTLKNSFINPFTFPKAVKLIENQKIKFTDYGCEYIQLNDLPILFESKSNPEVIKYQVML